MAAEERRAKRLLASLAVAGVCLVARSTPFVQKPPLFRGATGSGLHREARGGEEATRSRLDPDGTGVISLETLDNADIFTILAEGDAFKEADRLYRRPVFGPAEWKKHRSSRRITGNLQTIFSSRISRAVLFEVLIIMASALLALLWYEPSTLPFFQAFVLDDTEWQNALLAYDPTAPPLEVWSLKPFTLTSSALSLLLVFKTNNSYGRWWEARIIWGGIVNKSRDIVRQVLARFPNEKNHLKEVMTGLVSAYSRALTFHMSDQTEKDKEVLREKLEEMLPAQDVEDIMNCTHKPMTVTGKLTYYLQLADLDTYSRMQIDEDLEAYSDYYGMCERIYKTPIPLSYTRLTGRFLTVWLLFLPFALYKEISPHWLLVPLCGLIALFIFGIEEVGHLIEEPFSALPLSTISDGIRASIFEALDIDRRRWPDASREVEEKPASAPEPSEYGLQETDGAGLL